MSSDTQMLIFGTYAFGAGLALIVNPLLLINTIKPVTGLLESLSGLKPMNIQGGENNQFLPMSGALAMAIGSYYYLAVLTGDEKFKRNTVPGRLIFAVTTITTCFYTPYGSGLLLAFGLGDVVTALLMGMKVGFGGGFGDAKIKRN